MLSRRLSRVVAQRAVAQPTLQRYVEVDDDEGNTWRRSDDETISTDPEYPNHTPCAKEGKAADANLKLKAVIEKRS